MPHWQSRQAAKDGVVALELDALPARHVDEGVPKLLRVVDVAERKELCQLLVVEQVEAVHQIDGHHLSLVRPLWLRCPTFGERRSIETDS